MGNNKRIIWLDTAKGIGILLVVFLHLDGLECLMYFNNWGRWIVTFYMVLFFILSGIFFKNNNLGHRCKRLLKPYMIFYILTYAFYVGKTIAKGAPIEWMSFFNPFLGKRDVVVNPPLWFLLALMEMNVIGGFLVRFLSPFCALGTSIVLSVVAYILGIYKIPNLYYFESALLCLPFFLGASVFRFFLLRSYRCWLGGIGILVSYFVFLVSPSHYNNISLNHIGSGYSSFIIVALLASVGLLIISQAIDKLPKINSILNFYGKNSLVVLCTHIPLMVVQPMFMNVITSPILGITLTFITVMIMEIPIIWFVNKYVSFVLGK